MVVDVFVVAIGLLITLHSKKIARADQMEFTLDREIYDGEEFEASQKDHGILEELATVLMAATLDGQSSYRHYLKHRIDKVMAQIAYALRRR